MNPTRRQIKIKISGSLSAVEAEVILQRKTHQTVFYESPVMENDDGLGFRKYLTVNSAVEVEQTENKNGFDYTPAKSLAESHPATTKPRLEALVNEH